MALRYSFNRTITEMTAEQATMDGHANDFSKARFGKIKVSPDGDSILIGLNDKNFSPLIYKYSQPAKPASN